MSTAGTIQERRLEKKETIARLLNEPELIQLANGNRDLLEDALNHTSAKILAEYRSGSLDVQDVKKYMIDSWLFPQVSAKIPSVWNAKQEEEPVEVPEGEGTVATANVVKDPNKVVAAGAETAENSEPDKPHADLSGLQSGVMDFLKNMNEQKKQAKEQENNEEKAVVVKEDEEVEEVIEEPEEKHEKKESRDKTDDDTEDSRFNNVSSSMEDKNTQKSDVTAMAESMFGLDNNPNPNKSDEVNKPQLLSLFGGSGKKERPKPPRGMPRMPWARR